MLPGIFGIEYVHYARWLSIHLHFERLSIASQSTNKEICMSLFFTQKYTRNFSDWLSTLTHGQAHEQLNVIIKGDGGFICLTECPDP